MKTSTLSLLFLSLFFSSTAFSAETLSGEVRVSDSIAAKLPKQGERYQGVLFIFARAAGTQRGMPLAVKRIPNPSSFPVPFSLSQKDAMIASTQFTGNVTVVARFSPSGDVMAKKGAFEGTASETQPITVGQKERVLITMDKEL